MTTRVQRRGKATAYMCARSSQRARVALIALAAALLACVPFAGGCTGPGLEPPGDQAGMTPTGGSGMDAGVDRAGSGGSAAGSSGAGAPGASGAGAGGAGAAGMAPGAGIGGNAGMGEQQDGGVDADEDAGALR
jgi:hypothetical protein